MTLILVLGSRCNAACGHCSTSCGPLRQEALDETTVFRVMDEAAALSRGELLKFALTGGEPFLDFELLLRVVARGKQVGGEVTCVSNGYWATSEQKARRRLTAVKEAGLTMLGISASRFHQQFVKIKRVEKAVRAARAIGLTCTVKYARTAGDDLDEDSIRAWAFSLGADDVQVFSVMPHLREGETLPDSEYLRTPGLPEGGCPAAVLTIRENGEAYTCCTPGSSNNGFFSLGNVNQSRLAEIRNRFYLGGLQQMVRDPGPIFFAREAARQGLADRLRPSYSSVCDLCTHIANDPMLAAVARESVRDFEARQFTMMLSRLGADAPRRIGVNLNPKGESHERGSGIVAEEHR